MRRSRREPLDPSFDVAAWALGVAALALFSTVLALDVAPSPRDALAVPAGPIVILWWFGTSAQGPPAWLAAAAALALLAPPCYLAFPSRVARTLALAGAWAWAACMPMTCGAMV